MNVLLILLVLTSLSTESPCLNGQQSILVQTGLKFDMYWVGVDDGKNRGKLVSFTKAVSEATACLSKNQIIRIREFPTYHWYKLNYRDGQLKELEDVTDQRFIIR